MIIKVLLASGTEDEWDGVEAEVEEGVLMIRDITEGTGAAAELCAVYAAGMWMKFELAHES